MTLSGRFERKYPAAAAWLRGRNLRAEWGMLARGNRNGTLTRWGTERFLELTAYFREVRERRAERKAGVSR